MRSWLSSRRLGRRLNAEDGVSLIEVLVATLLLTIGVLGLLGGFNSSRSLTLLSERHTAMAHRAQLEIERLQAVSSSATTYGELAMKSAPSHSTETTNPDYYVNSSPTKCTSVGDGCYAWNANSTSEEEPLVYAASGGAIAISPSGRQCSKEIGACEWEDGKLSGNVYDFVTWHTDTFCATVAIKCTTTKNNYKRLTVVVTLKVPSGSKEVTPLRVSTMIAEP